MPKQSLLTKHALLTEFAIVSFVMFLLLYIMTPKFVYQQTEGYTIRKIEEYGGFMKFDEKDRVVEVNLVYGQDENGKRVDVQNRSDDIIEFMPRLQHLKRLYIRNEQASNEAMKHIGKIHSLERILMWEAEVSDVGFAKLSGLPDIQYIFCGSEKLTNRSIETLSQLKSLTGFSLHGSNFSDEGFKHLKKLENLETLYINSNESSITDEGIKHLAQLKHLKRIGIRGWGITNGSIEVLKQLKRLDSLDITHTSITNDMRSELNSKLPNITIYPVVHN